MSIALTPAAKTASSGSRGLRPRSRHEPEVVAPSAPAPKVCPRCRGHLYRDMSDDALTLTCLSCGHSIYPLGQGEAKAMRYGSSIGRKETV